jgi:hypothetical protein
MTNQRPDHADTPDAADSPSDRRGFVSAVQAAFGFLLERGFRLADARPDVVRYESPASVLEVWFDFRGGELEVVITPRQGTDERGVYLGSIMDFFGASDARPKHGLMAGSAPAMVTKLVGVMAARLRQYGGLALAGDLEHFEQLRQFTSERARTASPEAWLAELRTEADEAWRSRDYAALVSVYDRMAADLMPSERKKLESARRRS